ncbi:MAG: DUF305 domain-containing protein [Longimicrobiales bacterium]
MRSWSPRGVVAGMLVVLTGTACSSATGRVLDPQIAPADGLPPAAALRLRQLGYTAADVHFMSGMIPHHAQAVVMAGWAATHGARSDVRILCERIVVGQADEIVTMQNWLRDRGQKVPDAQATHLTMTMNGVEHDMLMPGMLTDEELAQLDRARGAEFDRLFLTFMIRHHEGALSMVDELFASAGAAQDDVVFKFASDVYADQSTEIDRMQTMLDVNSTGGSR